MDPITAGVALVALLTAAGGIYAYLQNINLAGQKLGDIERAVAAGKLSPSALLTAPGGGAGSGLGAQVKQGAEGIALFAALFGALYVAYEYRGKIARTIHRSGTS